MHANVNTRGVGENVRQNEMVASADMYDGVTYDSVELGSRRVWWRAVGWRKSHVEHSVTLDLTVPRVVSDNEDWFDFSLLSYGFGDSPWSSPFEMKGWWWERPTLNVLRGTLGGCTNMWIKVYCICLLQWSCKEELHETFSPCFLPVRYPLIFLCCYISCF